MTEYDENGNEVGKEEEKAVERDENGNVVEAPEPKEVHKKKRPEA